MQNIPQEHPEPDSRQFLGILRLLLFAVLVTAVLLLFNNKTVRHDLFDLEILRHFLRGSTIPGGILTSAGLFLLGGGLLVGIGLPRLWVSVVAGAIYGILPGFLLALSASLVGSAIVYSLGETLLAPYVVKRFGRRKEKWTALFHENAFWWVLYLRLFPFANASLSGLFCGCCKVPFRQYLAGSAIGFMPLTAAFVIFGSAGISGNSLQIVLGFIFLLLSVAVRYLLKKANVESFTNNESGSETIAVSCDSSCSENQTNPSP